MTEYIATDFTGVLTGVHKTTMHEQFEQAHRAHSNNPNLKQSPLETYASALNQYVATDGELSSDHALIEFYENQGRLGLTKQDMEDAVDTAFENGTINRSVVNALVTLGKEHGKRIVIVSKNSNDEMRYVAKKINEQAGEDIVYATIGCELEYEADGTIAGVSTVIADKDGEPINGTKRLQKSRAVEDYVGEDYHFISDEKDLDIAEAAVAKGNKAILIRHLPDGEARDPYFAHSPDYQEKTMKAGAYNVMVENEAGLEDRLVEELGEGESKQEDTQSEASEEA